MRLEKWLHNHCSGRTAWMESKLQLNAIAPRGINSRTELIELTPYD